MAIRDPFEKASPDKVVTQILWNEQPLQISLADLGPTFSLRGLNEGNAAQARATNGLTTVRPGAYLLAAPGKSTVAFTAQTVFNHIKLGEFVAPAPTALGPQARHLPPIQTTVGIAMKRLAGC